MKFGIGYRREVADRFQGPRPSVEVVEVLVEHFVPLTTGRRAELRSLRDRFVVLPHCVGMSLGSCDGPSPDYLDQVAEVAEVVDAPFVSDHASASRAPGFDLGHLAPVWRVPEALEVLCTNIGSAEAHLGRPLAIETITESFSIPDAAMSWVDFHVELGRTAGAGLLVDLTNLWINEVNRTGPAALDCLAGVAQVRWSQFHLVGYGRSHDGTRLLDLHDRRLSLDIVRLFSDAIEIQRPDYAVIERDTRMETFDEVFEDLEALGRLDLAGSSG